jgi:hypothetical protein
MGKHPSYSSQKILTHQWGMWLCVVLLQSQIALMDKWDNQRNGRRARSPAPCHLGTYTLISSSSDWSSSFYSSCEAIAQVLRTNLTVLYGDGNTRMASSWAVIRAAQLVETYV